MREKETFQSRWVWDDLGADVAGHWRTGNGGVESSVQTRKKIRTVHRNSITGKKRKKSKAYRGDRRGGNFVTG